MAQRGEVAPGLRGCASDRPTGFGGKASEEGSEGEAAIPLLRLSVLRLPSIERGETCFLGMNRE